MPAGFGYSFQPGSQDTPMQQGGARQMSAPDAIRVLSLRIPEQGRSPVPLPLLRGRGAGGLAGLDQVLAALIGAFQAEPGGGTGPAPSPSQMVYPSPNFTVTRPPNLGGTSNPEALGPSPPSGTIIPWPSGEFTPQAPQYPQYPQPDWPVEPFQI